LSSNLIRRFDARLFLRHASGDSFSVSRQFSPVIYARALWYNSHVITLKDSDHIQGRTQGGIKEFIYQKLPKLDLPADAEYVVNLIDVSMWL